MGSSSEYASAIVSVGLIIPPSQPPERFRRVAVAADRAGLDEVWLWEDCFAESGIAPAATVLGATERVRVGIGLLPVPLRNVALCAMEVASLSRLFPGRLLPGVGHGVAEWMAQVGAEVASPLTLLAEYAGALRRLLAGEEVTTAGRYVSLDRVRLHWPPAPAPPVFVGGVGPKTLALAGAVGDGVIFTGDTAADAVAAGVGIVSDARRAAGRDGAPEVVTFAHVPIDEPVERIEERVAVLEGAGATHVAACAIGDRGPDGTERLVEFAERLGGLERMRRSGGHAR